MSFNDQPKIKDKIKIVVNRAGLDNGSISMKKAQETIGKDIFWQVPNDYRTMVEVRNNGVPLLEHAPKAALTTSISQMTEALCGEQKAEEEPAAKPAASSVGKFFSFLNKKK